MLFKYLSMSNIGIYLFDDIIHYFLSFVNRLCENFLEIFR